MTMINMVAAGTKTIILTSTPDTWTLTSVEIAISSDGSTYTTVCSTCNIGYNDFSSANSNTGLVSFKYLKVTWITNKYLCICEVWVYPYTNHMPFSTVTGNESAFKSV